MEKEADDLSGLPDLGEELDEREADEEAQIAEAEAEVALGAKGTTSLAAAALASVGEQFQKRPVSSPGESPDRVQRSSKRNVKAAGKLDL